MKKLIVKTVLAGIICGLAIIAVLQVKQTLFTSELFAVRTVEVRGAVHADAELLKNIYSSYVGANIFSEIAANNLHTEDEWVLKLTVKRVLPDKLIVNVIEDEELIRYKDAKGCSALTARGKHIPVSCEGVNVTVAALPLAAEFVRFAELYKTSEFLQKNSVVVRNGFFTVNTGEEILIAAYTPAVFESNFERYTRQIKDRYRQIERVDLSIPGRVYVKGVIRG
ncbi:MAG: FtsQ-type POTRA domain-containing protein [Deferribacteraceae bacterium]|jgi:cell division protein FtsQ|nr:FtsQ-type POTRA domain-containing protein [Deferribacteraceae bacterium]